MVEGLSLLPTIFLFVVSLVVLIKGSDVLIGAAERIGLGLGISPFLIGVTIVGFGTSLPELATSIAAVYSGSSEVVTGNVIGSNVTNILLVLGIAGIFSKEIKLEFQIINIDVPFLLISAFLLFFFIRDGAFTLPEAVLCIISLLIFLFNTMMRDKKDESIERKVDIKDFFWIILAGVMVYFGANYTMETLIHGSEMLSIPKDFVSATALALGTSLPEVVVSILAARKGNAAIAVGNVMGSNVFNTYAVMAIPTLIQPLEITQFFLSFGLPFMLGVTLIFAIITISRVITRWESYMLIVCYGYYILEAIKSIS